MDVNINSKLRHLYSLSLYILISVAIGTTASAEAYKWPDNIPPEAKALMEPMPL
jgi:ribose transport system substrate-binding protein